MTEDTIAVLPAPFPHAIGDTLENGATLIDCRYKPNDIHPNQYIVLARTPGGEWVTWQCSSDTRRGYYWGHYFDGQDLVRAAQDMIGRSGGPKAA